MGGKSYMVGGVQNDIFSDGKKPPLKAFFFPPLKITFFVTCKGQQVSTLIISILWSNSAIHLDGYKNEGGDIWRRGSRRVFSVRTESSGGPHYDVFKKEKKVGWFLIIYISSKNIFKIMWAHFLLIQIIEWTGLVVVYIQIRDVQVLIRWKISPMQMTNSLLDE